MKIALDTNLLVYLAQAWRVPSDREKAERTERILLSLSPAVTPILPYQVIGEAYNVMSRFGFSRDKCRQIVLKWIAQFEIVASRETAFASAIDLATDHNLQFWDALIINVAADAGCQLLLSEDMQSGFTWRGVTVVNPFAATMDARLARLLTD